MPPSKHGHPSAGWMEILLLLYVTPDRQLALDAYGAGDLRRISRTFRSGMELGHCTAGLLEDPRAGAHPALAALRAAARVIPQDPDGGTARTRGGDD